jgi:DNA helicase-2/ATP-dependent DNA helicase PcrA
MLLDIEASARPGRIGRAHLDAFADVVADYAEASPSASLPALLDYLAAAETAEDGLEPGEIEVVEDRVQILTVHSAKGLEWDIVAVPHVVNEIFPSRKRASCWLRNVTELPAELRGDAADLPVLDTEGTANRKEVEVALDLHADEFAERDLVEERRLCYVALTRSAHTVLLSAHWWGRTGSKPRGPSPFFTEIAESLSTKDVIDHLAGPPEADAQNPFTTRERTAQWPVDPLRDRRTGVEEGARLVREELQALAGSGGGEQLALEDDPDGWVRDTDVLIAERAAAVSRRERVALPDQISVTQLVELAADPEALARRLRRPLPYPPNPVARRGTAFHVWLEKWFGSRALLDVDELPGAADATAMPDEELEELKEAFLASGWANRVPHEVEVPFACEVDGVSLRGRMDAVFADPDGGWTVVDWKTGLPPPPEARPALTVQLAAYRLAWAGLSGTPIGRVRAAFHYVRHDHTLRPADLLDIRGVRDLLRSIPAG